ncbi:MAG: class I SAM-dependent methyltransferase [Candidatus Cloacimonetes bacterium]|nr:class I SAM-dependent methyltransferase [Candidatus Cloacimonadota bacterium]MCF7814502.1 class I SAM-dependent methyltransferase [Candidatus Cloacimonadota bacterium]MCF7869063.1 class I SAM-dependent methyltransferase [Candidatus Cloacimonadota bacterium]MCF7884458.1 class I SAM-dependent methyltransferase [Candidatus Cloacimonadota bacterium]
MAIPILKSWQNYFENPDEGLGSSYERIILNRKLDQICLTFGVQKVLEAPSFGFTGLSGINSMNLTKQGKKVSIVDNDKNRLEKIKKVWNDADLDIHAQFSKDFSKLPFSDKSFDLSWNFSALWFAKDLDLFLQEMIRTTRKVIMLCVPNRAGIGYLSQKFLGKDDLKKHLKEDFIIPRNFKRIMIKNNWDLLDSGYIDCPPWPDIGMPKEKFLKIFGLSWLIKSETDPKPLTIMDYYNDIDPDFADKMMQHSWFERSAPNFIKRFWAHHRYFIFVPTKDEK